MYDALRHKNQRAHQADREQHPKQTTRRIHPEISKLIGLLPRDAANNRNRNGNADRRRSEVVIGEAGHLREIAHGRFAAVRLPVGIGGKRRSGAERQPRLEIREFLRIKGENFLHPLD